MGIVSKNRKFFECRPSSDKRRRSSLSSSTSSSLSSSLTKSLTTSLSRLRGGGPSHLRVVDTSDRTNGGMTNEEIDRHIESLLSSLDISNGSNYNSSSFTSQSSILSCQDIKQRINELVSVSIKSASRNKDVTIYNEIIDSLLAYLDEPLATSQQQQAHILTNDILDNTSLDEAVIDYNHRGLIDYEHELLEHLPGVKRCSMLSSSSLSFDEDSYSEDESSSNESSLDETIVDYKHRQAVSATVIDYEQYWSKGVIPMCPQSSPNNDRYSVTSPPTLISFATPGKDDSYTTIPSQKKQEKSRSTPAASAGTGSSMLPFLPMSPGATAA